MNAPKKVWGSAEQENIAAVKIAEDVASHHTKALGERETDYERGLIDAAVAIAARIRVRRQERSATPAQWARPEGFVGPCPGCGSTTCGGYYKPDGTHLLAF